MSVQTSSVLFLDELIHDVEYNFYGDKLASVSSDYKVKVTDLQPDAESTVNDYWKAHSAPILRVAWTDPQFGQILATCSFDKLIKIWEEQDHEPKNSGKRWIERSQLVESKSTVYDIGFSPSHLGLKLASVSSEGIVRTYEAMDVVNLGDWSPVEEFHVNGGENQSLSNPNEPEVRYCLSWCPSYVPSGYLAVGSGAFNSVKVFQNESNAWNPVLTLDGHQGVVNDVAWANTIGRSFHLIASACHDGKVRIYQVTLPSKSEGLSTLPSSPQSSNEQQHSALASGSPTPQPSLLPPKHTSQLVAEFGDHQAPVWRVKWNITGTVLSSSGDDGKIRLWKSNNAGVWKCISSVNLDNNAPSNNSMHNNPVASSSISIANSQNNIHSMNAIPLPAHD